MLQQLKMPIDNRLILAIETAIGGGSISLYKGALELSTLEGEKEISRAEDLLANITDLLTSNAFKLNDLDEIAVSIGPGSYTGIRVGIATALGLKKALGTTCSGIDVLQALELLAPASSDIITAVPLGRSDVCWRVVDNGIRSEIIIDKAEVFFDSIESREGTMVVVHEALYDSGSDRMINAGTGISRHIASAARAEKYSSSLDPLYVRG